MKSIEHQYDCSSNHRIMMTTDMDTCLYGKPSSYEHAAFFHDVIYDKWYVAVTQYYEGDLSLNMCEGVYKLTKVGDDTKDAKAYNFFSCRYSNTDEKCPWLDKPDTENVCSLEICPQKDRRQTQ